jgi:uncharacterized membrane protein YciS (DUF1049 family)
MSEAAPLHGHAQSSDTNPDLRGAHGVIFHVETLGKGVAAILIAGIILAVLLAGMAFMRTDVAIEQARVAERETKLAREDIRVMSIALASHGINSDEHATEKGEKK